GRETMRGNERMGVQRGGYPKAAPVTEYVEMPEGSSSAAPVVSPGPRSAKNVRRRAGRTPAAFRMVRAPFFTPFVTRVLAAAAREVALRGSFVGSMSRMVVSC